MSGAYREESLSVCGTLSESHDFCVNYAFKIVYIIVKTVKRHYCLIFMGNIKHDSLIKRIFKINKKVLLS